MDEWIKFVYSLTAEPSKLISVIRIQTEKRSILRIRKRGLWSKKCCISTSVDSTRISLISTYVQTSESSREVFWYLDYIWYDDYYSYGLLQKPMIMGKPMDDDRKKTMNDSLAMLEEYLTRRMWVSGDMMTIADLSVLSTVSTLEVCIYTLYMDSFGVLCFCRKIFAVAWTATEHNVLCHSQCHSMLWWLE